MVCSVFNACDVSDLFQKQVIEKINALLFESKCQTEWVDLSDYKLQYCRGCDYCLNVNPGVCFNKDGQNELLQKYINSDLAVIITPVIFGCCISKVKNFIDRTEPLFLSYQVKKNGITKMKARYPKYPELVFIGVKEGENENSIANFTSFALDSNLAQAGRCRSIALTKREDIDALESI